VFDSWHSQRFPTPESLDPYWGPLNQGLQGSFPTQSRSLDIRLPTQTPFTADVKRVWSYAFVPPAFLNGADSTSAQYVVQHTAAHPSGGGGGGGGQLVWPFFLCQLLIHFKSTRHHADGSR
jgi:hypothetical protein